MASSNAIVVCEVEIKQEDPSSDSETVYEGSNLGCTQINSVEGPLEHHSINEDGSRVVPLDTATKQRRPCCCGYCSTGKKRNMFSVIELEDGLQLVPSSWVDDENMICLWPPFFFNQIKLNKMVSSQILPEQSWTKLRVLKHFGKSDCYKRGIEKLELCIGLSDIDPALSEEERRKIMRKRVMNLSDLEDETLATLPPYSKQPKKEQILLSKNTENLDVDSKGIQFDKEHPKTRQCECDGLNNSAEFKELILGKMNFIINQISVLEEKVDSLIRNNSTEINSPGLSELMKKFSLKDISEVKEMEKFICEEENYKILVLSLKGIGGSSDQHIIRNMLKRVLSIEVGEQFSWVGAKGKSSFKDLQLIKAILETARFHCPSITEGVFGNVVGNWLRHSKQRREREKGYRNGKLIHLCPYDGCCRVFGKSCQVYTHLTYHTGEKPYVCSFENCGKKFKRSDDMMRHERIHTNERNHVCQNCKKTFLRSDHLSKHMKRHSKQILAE